MNARARRTLDWPLPGTVGGALDSDPGSTLSLQTAGLGAILLARVRFEGDGRSDGAGTTSFRGER